MNQNSQRKRKKKKFSSRQVIMVLGVLLAAVLLNLAAFYGLLYRNEGQFLIPPDSVSAGADALTPSDPSEGKDSLPPDDIPSGSDLPSTSDKVSGGSSEGDEKDKYSYEAQHFKADLTAYEEFMNPEGDDYLLLVNVEHPLTREDVPDDLTVLKATRDDGRDPQRMRLIAAKALEALFLEAEQDGILYDNNGITLSVTSAYRSYGSQESIFNNYVNETMASHPSLSREEAERQVMTYSCRPGTSEHQSGLCCDMHNFPAASVSNGMREKFAASKAGQWLVENCARFGFVLRFPADKTDVTGIEYESWHFRFVGRYHAMRMQESGMCLEEYVKSLS